MIESIDTQTHGRGLHEITDRLQEAVRSACETLAIEDGLCTVMIQHTSASLTIQENADPSAQYDLERFLERLVPDGDPAYRHRSEGPDDMPSHIKAALTSTTLSIPIVRRSLALGTWQGVFLWEHRLRGSRRRIVAHIGG